MIILDDVLCISFWGNDLEKCMNLTLFLPAMSIARIYKNIIFFIRNVVMDVSMGAKH